MDCSIFFGDNGSLGGIFTIKEINSQKNGVLARRKQKQPKTHTTSKGAGPLFLSFLARVGGEGGKFFFPPSPVQLSHSRQRVALAKVGNLLWRGWEKKFPTLARATFPPSPPPSPGFLGESGSPIQNPMFPTLAPPPSPVKDRQLGMWAGFTAGRLADSASRYGQPVN